jgi:hypothetical protein
LGNQLFQFAAAKQLELEGASISFSLRTDRRYGSPIMGHESLEQFVGERLHPATKYQELATGYLPRRIYKSVFVDSVLDSPIFLPSLHRILATPDFDPRPAALPDRPLYRLQGYFQHPSWWDRSLPSVIARIEGTTLAMRACLPSFDLCVHLRRGDYVALGWALSFDHYVGSLALLTDRVKSVVVTSDDDFAARTYCEYLRANGYDAYTASQVETSSESSTPRHSDPVLFDFCLMANAKNIIMSNSTFCWWATVLGDHLSENSDERTVIYPRGWNRHQDDTGIKLAQPNWTVFSSPSA